MKEEVVEVTYNGKPVKASEIIPESDDEKRRYNDALTRREKRLQQRDK